MHFNGSAMVPARTCRSVPARLVIQAGGRVVATQAWRTCLPQAGWRSKSSVPPRFSMDGLFRVTKPSLQDKNFRLVNSVTITRA